MKSFIGGTIGFIIGFIVWFPYGIMYTVQSYDNSMLVKTISILKGLLEL
ncbi:hypothetical protein [Cytobacillus praedii]|nr:hypothetical protein [Cytobacillus praedii]